jgi:hypothetical protein
MAEQSRRICSLLQKLDLDTYDGEEAVTEREEGVLEKIVNEIQTGLVHSFWDELANSKISPQSVVAFCTHTLSGRFPIPLGGTLTTQGRIAVPALTPPSSIWQCGHWKGVPFILSSTFLLTDPLWAA